MSAILPARGGSFLSAAECLAQASGTLNGLHESGSLGLPQDVPNTELPPEVVADLPEMRVESGDVSSGQNYLLEAENVPCSCSCKAGADSSGISDCSEGSISEEPELVSLRKRLQEWSLEAAVPHATVTKLLKILRSHQCFSELPASARTLLCTPRSSENIKSMGPGQYCHFGLSEGLRVALQHVPQVPDPVIIHINVDGLPLTKSTRDQFWPILCHVANCEGSEPFPVGVYYGQAKALEANVFLEAFVTDLNTVLQKGELLGNSRVKVQLGAIICDAPAKSYILCIKGHTGYFSCSKCTTEGDFLKDRMSFPQLDAPLRTDASFRTKQQEEHHSSETILEQLPIDLVRQVPLDYMHLICLGVMRKLLLLWVKGEKSYRIGKAARESLSGANVESRHHVPSDMSRKPRSLSDLDRWKASELRLILLYTGPVVLRLKIPDHLMDNFLTLHCAVTILSSPVLCTVYLDYAHKLLMHFVETYITLYGKHSVSHNVHGLIHVANDVRTHGSLHSYSAFPFENYMQKLKKYVRKPEKPLQQLSNRIAEERSLASCLAAKPGNTAPSTSQTSGVKYTTGRVHEAGPLPQGCIGPQYKSVRFLADISIKTTRRDSTCMMKDGSIVKVENIAHSAAYDHPVLVGRRYQKLEDLYTYPCSSSLLDVYLASKPSEIHFWPLKEVAAKCVRLPVGTKYAVFPMVHQK
ncbi:uncharacterized protein LOC144177729 [Haemaphysalis longicornis]